MAMNKKKHISVKGVLFLLVCIFLSITFFAMVVAGIFEVRQSLHRESYFSEASYERALLEERYDDLTSYYHFDFATSSTEIHDKYRPLVQYYEAAFLCHAYQVADHPEEAKFETEKMLRLQEAYPEHQHNFDKMKEACGL